MSASTRFAGSIVAIVTPMRDDGALDLPSLKRLIDWHVAEGTDGIVIVGTTGESPTVDHEEHCQLIKSAVEYTAGRVPVIAGTGANSTAEAIDLMRFAKSAGADACLSVVPYYNRPTQEGLYRHFRAQAEACDLPMIMYNVPGRTVADMANETVVRLAEVPGIVGLKDATDNIERASLLLRDLARAGREDFTMLSGCDGTALAFTLMGGQGTISVTANVAPGLMHKMIAAARAGDVAGARLLNTRLLALHQRLFVEPNPVPVKWALARMGRCGAHLRLPLAPLAQAHHAVVEAALREAGAL
ncbi:MAG: 4-hydroxy-tetrahydrodipicolinate synthase [Burkholderiales bacterium]|nr:4-hydroxy-tetrahydrodipicolinate synthase [Burkholderiales bacterium]